MSEELWYFRLVFLDNQYLQGDDNKIIATFNRRRRVWAFVCRPLLKDTGTYLAWSDSQTPILGQAVGSALTSLS